MRVELVSYTKDCEKIIAVASKLTLSKKSFEEIWESMSEEEIDTWIRETVIRWHLSPWEHCVYTFFISDVSRVLTHQLVRHRIASYTQHSQRFRAMKKIDFVIPQKIVEREDLKNIYEESLERAAETYELLINKGTPFEDARYILPQAVTTKILVTMNARELWHFFSLRMCTRAQREIRELAWKMWTMVYNLHPKIWKWAGPRCVQAENLIRKDPIELPRIIGGSRDLYFISEKCPENLPRDSILRCMYHGYTESLNK